MRGCTGNTTGARRDASSRQAAIAASDSRSSTFDGRWSVTYT